MTSNFSELRKIHSRLYDIFFEHQEALLEKDLSKAKDKLNQFIDLLLLHQKDEEELLMPIFCKTPNTAQDQKQLLMEHKKLNTLLAQYQEYLERISISSTNLNRDIICLIDYETSFKHLLEHHDEREKTSFFPILDQITTSAQKEQLIQLCLQRL